MLVCQHQEESDLTLDISGVGNRECTEDSVAMLQTFKTENFVIVHIKWKEKRNIFEKCQLLPVHSPGSTISGKKLFLLSSKSFDKAEIKTFLVFCFVRHLTTFCLAFTRQ